ncbi:GerMN domain-containing protein [Proteiniborus sp. MB09-C3]|uniref:GerMN domain-containing protein n=1 Tax=Proteiniborus sp. MB09-C3 TaxID=3050072 RepID=UPI0025571E74|nr:GerMN domain-containing protein [Proteiniborus sp. MB09-C3]WIV11885.1 GerMN domain-containing protein [Proteiniborus sp. MB09-C3]
MYIKKLFILAIVLVLALGLFGCKAIDTMKDLITNDEPEIQIIRSDDDANIMDDASLRNTVLYYQNENGYLVPVKRKVPWEEGIAKAALKNMTDTPTIREDIGSIGLKPLIPAGTEIIGMSINQDTGLCKVDFNSQIMNSQSKKDEENMIKGVVYTLTEFSNIKEVQFMVDGKIVPELKYGTKVQKPLVRADINVVEGSSDGTSKVTVYYKGIGNGEYEYYVPVTVPTSAPTTNILTSLETLFKGAPELSGLYSDIPDGIEFQGVEVYNRVAYVDIISHDFEIISDQAVFNKMTKNIGLTLKEFPEIEYVEILFDGKTIEEAGLELDAQETVPVFANEY